MKFILTVFSCVLLSPLWGQYAYYNEYMPLVPNSAFSLPLYTNILPIENDLYLYGANYSDRYNQSISKVNSLGQFYDTLVRPMELGEYRYIEKEEAIISIGDNYLWGGAGQTLDLPKTHAQIIRYDSNFNIVWKYEDSEHQQDWVYSSQYIGVRENLDGSFIAAGLIQYDSVPSGNTWTSGGSDLLLTKISADGIPIWNQVYQITHDELFTVNQAMFLLTDVIVAQDDNIYVWGQFYPEQDPFVIRFNTNGLFLDHLVWGSSTFQDGAPYPVLIGDHQFAVAYNNGISGNDLDWQQQIRIGILDGILMQFHWLGTYNYPHGAVGMSDFEKTTDGGYIVVGSGGTTDTTFPGEAYLLKVNNLGEEQWYYNYYPPVTYNGMETYDLEVLPDGGFAFIGTTYVFHQYTTPWLVRTNACGELINNGCIINGVLEEQPATEQSFVPYPNPTSGICNLKGLQDVSLIEVINATGQLVLRTNNPTGQTQMALDLSSYSIGIYTVRLLDTTGLSIGQYPIIKE